MKKAARTSLVAAILLIAIGGASPAHAAITGDSTYFAPLPGATGVDSIQITSPWGSAGNSFIRAWNEKQQYALVSPGTTNTDPTIRYEAQATYGPSPYNTPSSAPTGTRVDSHFMHFQPNQGPSGVTGSGCISLDSDVFGVQTSTGNIHNGNGATNNLWSQNGGQYEGIYQSFSGLTNRGLEPPDPLVQGSNTDYILIDNTPDQPGPPESRVCVSMRWFEAVDEIRIVTAGVGSVGVSPQFQSIVYGTQSQACVTATATRSSFGGYGGNAATSEPMKMNMSGPNATPQQSGNTNGAGQISFCSPGNNAGTDNFTVFNDSYTASGETGPDAILDGGEIPVGGSITWLKRATSTTVSCPGPVSPGSTVSCTVTVRDTSPPTVSDPTGTVTLQTNGSGNFSSSTCASLQVVSTGVRRCTANYTPTICSSPHTITASYQGDATHNISSAQETVNCAGKIVVVKDTPQNTGQDFPFSFTGRRLTFASSRDGNQEIYAMNPDGTDQTRLTNNPAVDYQPDWSFDRSKIAFASSRDGNLQIYTMNADGSGQTRLTNNGASDQKPSWSPDGSKIVFQSNRDDPNEEIYVMNADGSGQTRLTNNPSLDSRAAWSPNGTKLAFQTSRDGNDEIYVMNPDGSSQTRITNNPASDQRPAWSPDSSKMAFSTNRDGGNLEVYTMNADGTTPTRLTNNMGADDKVDWAPDTRIAFHSDRQQAALDVFVMNADGSGQTALTAPPQDGTLPSWGLQSNDFTLDDDSDPTHSSTKTFNNLIPGKGYSVTESSVADWQLQSASCSDGSPVSNVDVSAGETVTCTFTNVPANPGTIVIKKDQYPDPDRGTDPFSFTTAGGLNPGSFKLDDDGDSENEFSDTQTFNYVPSGIYTVQELGNSFSIGVSCDDDASATPSHDNHPSGGATIKVDPNETVTCTFVNSEAYPRTATATPLRVPLVPAYEQCTSPDTTHVAPLDYAACSNPSLESNELTMGKLGQGSGFARLRETAGNPSTPANEADIRINVDATDVRKASDNSDYTGRLILATTLRITDRLNDPLGEASGTVKDSYLSAPVDCVATPGASGGRCTLNTTANALAPNFAREEHRSVMSLLNLEIKDAGPDGSVLSNGFCPDTDQSRVVQNLGLVCGSGDEAVFLRSGLFTP